MDSNNRQGKKIVDDIATLDVSRQRKYQIRRMREGLCIICGRPAYRDTLYCSTHNLKRGIRQPGRNRHRARKWIRDDTEQFAESRPNAA